MHEQDVVEDVVQDDPEPTVEDLADAATAEADAVTEGEGAEEGEAEQTEGEETPAEEEPATEAEEKPEAKPAAEKPAAADPPAPNPEEIERSRKAQEAFYKWRGDFSDVVRSIESDKFDVVDDGPKAIKTLIQGIRYQAAEIQQLRNQIQETATATSVEKVWSEWGRANPDIPVAKSREIFDEEVARAYQESPKASVDEIRGAARAAWKYRLQALRATAAARKNGATPAPKAPPVNRGGARLTAGTGQTRPPAPKSLSAADQVLKEFGPPEKVI